MMMMASTAASSSSSTNIFQYNHKTSPKGNVNMFSYTPPQPTRSDQDGEEDREEEVVVNDVLSVVSAQRNHIIDLVKEQLNKLNGIKWYVAVQVELKKSVNGVDTSQTPVFHGKFRTLLPGDVADNGGDGGDVDASVTTEVQHQFSESMQKIMESMAKYVKEGSGWMIDHVLRIDVGVIVYRPLFGSSYIETPKALKHPRKGLLNIQNHSDEKCFAWSILAQLHPLDNNRTYAPYYKRYISELNMDGVAYPVKISDINKFEKNNPEISVNVFGYERNEVYPIRITKCKGRQHHVNLLLLTNNDGNTHYCLITSLSRFLSHLTKHKCESFYCNYCLHRFSRRDLLTEHEPLCEPYGAQKIKMPDETNKWMYFKNYSLMHKVPYTIYCDFESFVVPVHTSDREPNTSYTNNVSEHIPSGFCYLIVE